MIPTPTAVDVSFREDEKGIIRIADTRVSLQSVIADYQRGSSAEQIVDHFSVLVLADVYAVISYYLKNRSEVEQYMGQQQQAGDETRAYYEARYVPQPTRAELEARRYESS